MPMLFKLAIWVAAAWITNAYAEVYKYGADEVATDLGVVSVQWRDRDDPAKGTKVLLGERIIVESSSLASIKATHLHGRDEKLILLSLESGGTACALSFQVVELRMDGRVALSNEFGNCNGLADKLYFKVKDNPVFRSGGWFIALAGKSKHRGVREGWELREEDKGEVEWFVYSDGAVSAADMAK